MLKSLGLCCATLISTPSFAATLIIDNPCHMTPWLKLDIKTDGESSVGQITIDALTAKHIPFLGSASGISSIYNTVTGMDALELISPTEMRAYGWCYRVNGFEPGLYAHEVFLSSDLDTIEWFFGFALYRDGTWVTMCEPTKQLKPAFICPAQSDKVI